MAAFVDINVLVRHLTGDPADMAEAATEYLRMEAELLITDVVAAGTVYVLESFYEAPRDQVAQALRSLVAFDSIVCVDPALLLRAVAVYEMRSFSRSSGIRRTDRAGFVIDHQPPIVGKHSCATALA